MRTPFVIAALAAIVALPAGADDIGDAALELCEKVKACSMAQIDKEDLTPEVEALEPRRPSSWVLLQNWNHRCLLQTPTHPPAIRWRNLEGKLEKSSN